MRATVKPPNERTNVGDREREEEEVTPQAVLSTPLFLPQGGERRGGSFHSPRLSMRNAMETFDQNVKLADGLGKVLGKCDISRPL